VSEEVTRKLRAKNTSNLLKPTLRATMHSVTVRQPDRRQWISKTRIDTISKQTVANTWPMKLSNIYIL